MNKKIMIISGSFIIAGSCLIVPIYATPTRGNQKHIDSTQIHEATSTRTQENKQEVKNIKRTTKSEYTKNAMIYCNQKHIDCTQIHEVTSTKTQENKQEVKNIKRTTKSNYTKNSKALPCPQNHTNCAGILQEDGTILCPNTNQTHQQKNHHGKRQGNGNKKKSIKTHHNIATSSE